MAEKLKDVAAVERSPMSEGKTIFMILTKGKTTGPASPDGKTPASQSRPVAPAPQPPRSPQRAPVAP
jgi:hypothetical protein